MTDNEIKKALEQCGVSNCLGCPCNTCDENCLDLLTPAALDLINRQQAEIERLKAMVDAELDTIHDLGDDYERVLEEECELIQKTRMEAIEEFLDKFDKRCLDGGIYPGFIRNLLEIVKDDMVGEQDD